MFFGQNQNAHIEIKKKYIKKLNESVISNVSEKQNQSDFETYICEGKGIFIQTGRGSFPLIALKL